MSAGFEEFTRAVTRDATPAPAPDVQFNRVAVLGGRPDARMLAALCLAEGAEVTLFSAYGSELSLLEQSSGIGIRGEGPVGSYHVNRDGHSVRTTAKLDAAVRDAEAIFLTGPIHKQRTYAMVLADHLSDGQVLVLAPGRSLGAVETAWMLRVGGCKVDVTVVEVQGLPYWFSSEGSGLTLSQAGPMAAACLPRGRQRAIDALKQFLPNIYPVESVLVSGFGDLSAAVEIPSLILGGAGLESGGPTVPMGGVPLSENKTFAALIGDDQISVIHGLAEERRQVASVFINRLNQGMRLQTDPTVIYGITKGEGVLGRGIRQSELRAETPWNTYVITGLPQTPIANPGASSIEAALNPSATDYIFFVAKTLDPRDGHNFAVTNDEHNANVAIYRALEAERDAQQDN